jgi:hypothetical protein
MFPSGEAEMRRGGQAPLMTPRGLGRGREMSLETPIVPEASPQGSARDKVCRLRLERLTRC